MCNQEASKLNGGSDFTSWDLTDRAVCAALAGDYESARFWLCAAREIVSFTRIRELVNKFLQRVMRMRGRAYEVMQALEVLGSIDSNLVLS